MSECPLSTLVNHVHVSFNVPRTFNQNSSDTLIENVCVTITGPRELLSPASDEKHCMHLIDLPAHVSILVWHFFGRY